MLPDNRGYKVQAVPAPSSTKTDPTNIINADGNNQKLKLFNLGKAISEDPIYKGTNQLPNPRSIQALPKKDHYQTMCYYNNIIQCSSKVMSHSLAIASLIS